MTFSNILQHKWKVLAALILLFWPVIVPEMLVHLTIEIIIFSLFAISMNLVLRGVGLLSFGHAAFFGVGAYAMALIGKQVPGMPLLLILALAAVTGFVFALLIGSLCVRARPAYFPLLTLAFQMLLFAVALKWRALTGGDDGMGITRPDFSLPFLGKISLLPVNHLYFFTLIIVVLAIIGCYLLL
ncbi:MAG: branched-chain amino acid ABC transporter permease, partial [Pseudomonadota bacterium]